MARELHRFTESFTAAATVVEGQVVALAATPGYVTVPATSGVEPHGVTITPAGANRAVAVAEMGSVVKVTAAATVTYGSDVGVVGATSSVGPVASGQFRAGRALETAVPGQVFALFVHPERI